MARIQVNGTGSAAVLLGSAFVACAWGCGGKGEDASPDAGPTLTMQEEFLAAHNRYRAEVTQPAGYVGVWSPIPPLSWSTELEAEAQAWANTLRDQSACKSVDHDPQIDALDQGESIFRRMVGLTPTGVVDEFANEKPKYTYSAPYTFSSDTAHYTQIIWRKTTELGCAVAQCQQELTSVWVCRYKPAGNVTGEPPF